MGNIVLLDDLTINKIAAGEVIERPASVVKELVENSIDAGATNINEEIKNGGISYIRVTDNGKGLQPDDMEIAFERHATSKIRSADDLETVKSMGFRGEALASIAAISRIEMRSKTNENTVGYKIVVEGGNILEKQEDGCPNGTTITIENLFFNTPVRYKFLKKDFTEAGYIEDVITRIALIHPEISIKLINSGKTIIQTSATGNMKNVVYNIYGKDIAENVLNVDYTYEDIRVTGVVGKPSISRSNRSNQLFFVNKRYIKDKTLTSSAEQAFKGLITIGKFGFVILNLEINPQKVDVNVHPAKLEVRFEEEQKVFKAVYHAIKDTLLKEDLVANTERKYDEEDNTLNINNNSRNTILNDSDEDHEEKSYGLFQKLLKNKVNKVEEDSEKYEVKEEKNDINDETIIIKNEEVDDVKEYKKSNNAFDFDSIINKMSDMQKSVSEFKNDTKEDSRTDNVTDNVEVSQDTIKIDNVENINTDDNQETKIITQEMRDELAQLLENQETQIITEEMQEEIKKETELEKIVEENKEETNVKNFDEMYTSVFGKAPVDNKKDNLLDSGDAIVPEMPMKKEDNISVFETEDNKIPPYKFIGIAFSTYIIIELGKELYMIDQHAAHERILYEKVKANYNKGENNESQLMLLPDVITLTHKEMDVARENMDVFQKAGFILEEFGENTIKLTGVPNICINLNTKELFLETLDEINSVARTAKQEIEERFIATVACKAAVKANMVLSKEEVDNLIKGLLVLPNPFACPHGRPTIIKMTRTDIEKKFSRR